jgi:predicted nucleic acid-binding protein
VLRDPKDDYLVALARASDAEAIVTGDAICSSTRAKAVGDRLPGGV